MGAGRAGSAEQESGNNHNAKKPTLKPSDCVAWCCVAAVPLGPSYRGKADSNAGDGG
jgi:hypothetical protein